MCVCVQGVPKGVRVQGMQSHSIGQSYPQTIGTEWALELEKILTFQPTVREIYKRYHISLLQAFVDAYVQDEDADDSW